MGFLSNSSDLMFWIDGVRMGLSLRRLLRDSSRLRGFFKGGGGAKRGGSNQYCIYLHVTQVLRDEHPPRFDTNRFR